MVNHVFLAHDPQIHQLGSPSTQLNWVQFEVLIELVAPLTGAYPNRLLQTFKEKAREREREKLVTKHRLRLRAAESNIGPIWAVWRLMFVS